MAVFLFCSVSMCFKIVAWLCYTVCKFCFRAYNFLLCVWKSKKMLSFSVTTNASFLIRFIHGMKILSTFSNSSNREFSSGVFYYKDCRISLIPAGFFPLSFLLSLPLAFLPLPLCFLFSFLFLSSFHLEKSSQISFISLFFIIIFLKYVFSRLSLVIEFDYIMSV